MARFCPVQGKELKKDCLVVTCMYYSNLKKACAHSELHGSTDIEDIALHKEIPAKELTVYLSHARSHSKFVVVLDEYIWWAHQKFKHSISRDWSEEKIQNIQQVIVPSIICKLSHTIYVQLLEYLVDQNNLDEFCQYKDMEPILIQDLLFDLDISCINTLLA